MKTIAALGPEGTFSDLAARSFVRTLGDLMEIMDIKYFKSIKSTFNAVGKECEFGVLPIENLSEGYVEVVLDLLMDGDLEIVHELLLPIQFSFVSYAESLQQIRKLFVQYVAEGQCSVFIEKLPDVSVIRTNSNMASLELLKEDNVSAGAIVPHHAIASVPFPLVVPNVNDYKNNATRFIVLARQGSERVLSQQGAMKTSFVVIDDNDYPGLLVGILSAFSNRGINLTSIMSRPAKTSIGKYHFFIDIEGHKDDPRVNKAFEEISRLNRVMVLGSYQRAHNQVTDEH